MPANPPPKRLEISVTPVQREIIRRIAKNDGRTVSQWVRNALAAELPPGMRQPFRDAEFWASD